MNTKIGNKSNDWFDEECENLIKELGNIKEQN